MSLDEQNMPVGIIIHFQQARKNHGFLGLKLSTPEFDPVHQSMVLIRDCEL